MNYSSELEVSVGLATSSGVAFVVPDVTATSENHTYQGGFVVISGVTNAQYIVNAPPFQTVRSSGVTQTRPAATNVTAVLQTENLYWDRRDIRVSVQLRDSESLATLTGTTQITLRAVPPGGEDAQQTTAQCGGRSDGVCSLMLTVSPGWFETLSDGDEIDVQVGHQGVFASCGSVRTTARTSSRDLTDTVFVELPSRPLQPGEVQRLVVRSAFVAQLKTHRITMTVGPGLEIVPGSCASSDSAWTGTCLQPTSEPQKINTAMSRENRGSAVQHEALFEVTVRASGSVTTDAHASVTLEITVVRDFNNAAVASSTNATVVAGNGVFTDGQGAVQFVVDSRAGIFASMTGPSELFNTAVLSGNAVARQVVITAVTRLSRAMQTASGATCSTSISDSIATVNSQCQVRLNGDESQGTDTVNIQVQLTGHSAVLPVRVMFPTDLTVTPYQNTLRRISGMFNESDSSCSTPLFQTTRIYVTASFTDPSGSRRFHANVHEHVQGRLFTSNSSVAVVNADGLLAGVSSGQVTLRHSILTVTTQPITVDGSFPGLGVIALDAIIGSSLSPVSRSGSLVGNSTQTVSFRLRPPTLEVEGDTALIVVYAILEDHSRIRLTADNGLELSTNNNRTILVTQDHELEVPVTPTGGSGPLLRAA